jgi:hypothetical protein
MFEIITLITNMIVNYDFILKLVKATWNARNIHKYKLMLLWLKRILIKEPTKCSATVDLLNECLACDLFYGANNNIMALSSPVFNLYMCWKVTLADSTINVHRDREDKDIKVYDGYFVLTFHRHIY